MSCHLVKMNNTCFLPGQYTEMLYLRHLCTLHIYITTTGTNSVKIAFSTPSNHEVVSCENVSHTHRVDSGTRTLSRATQAGVCRCFNPSEDVSSLRCRDPHMSSTGKPAPEGELTALIHGLRCSEAPIRGTDCARRDDEINGCRSCCCDWARRD